MKIFLRPSPLRIIRLPLAYRLPEIIKPNQTVKPRSIKLP